MIAAGGIDGRKLKLKFGELINRLDGLEKAAGFCRVGRSTLARYASLSPADSECFAPIDVVMDLERLVGEPSVTAYLCTVAGGSYVELPKAVATGADILMLLGAQARAQGDLTTAVCTALADGAISKKEAEQAIGEADDVIREAVRLRAELLPYVGGQS